MPTMTEYIRHPMRLDLNRLSPDPAWPTKRQDLQAAVAIRQRHAAAGEPLRLLEAWGEAADGERLWVRFPVWRRALARRYPGTWRRYLDAVGWADPMDATGTERNSTDDGTVAR